MTGARLNYPGAGATRHGPQEWPDGYRRLRVRTRLGHGQADFEAAAEALSTWRQHREAGVRFGTEALRASPGVDVVVGLGVGALRLHAPCRVVWTVAEERSAGWAYGTLPGHPVRGEEAFVVSRDAGGTVWLEVRAFSRPVSWFTVAAGPLLPVFQRWYARRCGTVLRRLVARARDGAASGTGTGPAERR